MGSLPRTLVTGAAATVLVATACSGGDPVATQSVTGTTRPVPSATTTSASPTAAPPPPGSTAGPSTTPITTTEPLVAGPTGLRAVQLGDAEAHVVAEMRSRFGAPDADSGWGPAANSPFGVCPGATTGARVRGVRWGRVRLLFSDADTDHGAAGTAHLMAYELTSFQGSGDAPTTAAGTGLGSTAGELEAAYGSRVAFHPAEEVLPDRFTIDLGPDGQVSGSLDAPPPSGTVTFVAAGAPCGE